MKVTVLSGQGLLLFSILSTFSRGVRSMQLTRTAFPHLRRAASSNVGSSLHRLAAKNTSHSCCRRILYSSSSSSSPPLLGMMSDTNTSKNDDFSLSALEERAKKLIEANKQNQDQPSSICLVIAGGGSNAISTLASTPGASSLLLEGILSYDRKSFRTYLRMSLEDVDADPTFRYTSNQAAKLASQIALRKAMGYRSGNLRHMAGCIGIGCSSSLVSPPSSDSGIGHIVATRADGIQTSLDISLAGKTDAFSRTRKEEDVFISHMIFQVVENIMQQKEMEGDDTNKSSKQVTTEEGDSIAQEWNTIVGRAGADGSPNGNIGVEAANRVLEGEEPIVVLLPTYEDGKATNFCALAYSEIPNGSLVFPGSFNPPHIGHETLANAAISKANSMSHRHDKKAIFMELSLTNADKAPIDATTVSERLSKFLKLSNMPERWGILLTRAPLFAEKVSVIQSSVLESTDQGGSHPEISFVIGTDTLVRIIDPKYYDDDYNQMLDALRSMNGVTFYVGGRLEQKKGAAEGEPPQFISGGDEIQGLPEDVKTKFIIIGEQDFRVDLSSSEIRAAAAVGK